LDPFVLGLFGDFIPKGGECGTKAIKWLQRGKRQASGFKDMRPNGENMNMKIKKGEV
jgi:hypothetical protein